ncbi:hypothetical protein ACF1AB_22580 [Streptomyces sp. NPDC014846]|uniref:hypothetical protein n=1 Tax=unclassified Streptomyces TaxID=2593676 RepID=UPI0037012851
MKDTDVTITVFMPGPTETDFFRRASQGLANKVLPDSAKAALHRSMAEPGTAEDTDGRD